MNTAQLIVPGEHAGATLRIAVAAYLARFKGQSRVHTESDLRSFVNWCNRQGLDPLAAQRPHIELFLRWMQEVGRYRPSTVSRRLSVVAGFYRTCVIDGLLTHSPADYVRRPRVSAESPTLGLSHLQLEAMLTASRQSPNINDFALVTMLGLLGLRIFEATGANIEALEEVHGHRVLRVWGKGDKIALVPLPPAVGRAIERAVDARVGGPILRSRTGSRMDRHCATRRLRALAAVAGVSTERMHPHMLRHTFVTTMLDAGVDLRDVQIAARHADPRTTMRYDRARKNLDRHRALTQVLGHAESRTRDGQGVSEMIQESWPEKATPRSFVVRPSTCTSPRREPRSVASLRTWASCEARCATGSRRTAPARRPPPTGR